MLSLFSEFLISWSKNISFEHLILFIVIVKIEPFFDLLFTSIVPFMRSTSRFVIVSPRPVPPNSLLLWPSCCWKALKIVFWSFTGIPIPVSITWIVRFPDWLPFNKTKPALIWIIPELVNLTAFPTRFSKIWRTLISSRRRLLGKLESISTMVSNLFSLQICSKIIMISFITSRRSKYSYSIFSRPASILERSRISLIIINRLLPAEWIDSR